MNIELLPKIIENFRTHLIECFSSVKIAYDIYIDEALSYENDPQSSFDEYFHDWAQSIWELLVERVTCFKGELLEIYGSGTDYDGPSSRVFFKEELPTHEIVCKADHNLTDRITGEKIDISNFQFDEFVSFVEGWYKIDIPFDHILLTERNVFEDYRLIVVPVEQITWDVKKI